MLQILELSNCYKDGSPSLDSIFFHDSFIAVSNPPPLSSELFTYVFHIDLHLSRYSIAVLVFVLESKSE